MINKSVYALQATQHRVYRDTLQIPQDRQGKITKTGSLRLLRQDH